jgi:hypothetical protein
MASFYALLGGGRGDGRLINVEANIGIPMMF